ncbi:Bacterial type II and III secretion system protein [Gimesia aquarii]|uniref:Bacterial type II and III secretion system protein n=2 Tax=Gimesia aquarii TaxID=2527964 RepID=A0A517WW20_9PLAN|nr:Bacterial type II and III secretion system protein [Gimesia aquarii]
MVARHLGVDVAKNGDVYFLGTLKPEDLGVLVRRVRRLDQEALQRSLEAVLTTNGKVHTLADGIVIASDSVEVLQKVDTVIDAIHSSAAVSWAVQLYVVSMTDKDARDLGFDLAPAVEVSYSLAALTSGNLVELGKIEAKFDAILRASDSRSTLRTMAEPMFLLADGETGTFHRGDSVPVPKRTVTDQGTVSITGYDQIEAGVSVDVLVREVTDSVLRLEVELKLDEIVELLNGEAPFLSGENYRCNSLLRSGRVSLIGSLERSRTKDIASQWLKWGSGSEKEKSIVQIWARAYRVDLNEKPNERASGPSERMSEAWSPDLLDF